MENGRATSENNQGLNLALLLPSLTRLGKIHISLSVQPTVKEDNHATHLFNLEWGLMKEKIS